MRSLYELTITVNDYDDPDHIEIEVEAAVQECWGKTGSWHDFGNPDGPALHAAAVHIAAVLGRVAVAVEPWLAWSRQTHRCDSRVYLDQHEGATPHIYEACSLSAPGVVDLDEEGLPKLWITVPKKERKVWLDRIAAALEAVARADRDVWDYSAEAS